GRRPDRRRRHPEDRLRAQGPRDLRVHHGPPGARDARDDGPPLPHERRAHDRDGHAARDRREPRGPPRLPRRGVHVRAARTEPRGGRMTEEALPPAPAGETPPPEAAKPADVPVAAAPPTEIEDE